MGSRCHPHVVEWFDQGMASGVFKLENGRHIILNEFPRLMKESRLRASARVGPDSLREFLLALNPHVVTLADGTKKRIRQLLAAERGQLPALRKVIVPVQPAVQQECWYVYTPPIEVMRESWHKVRPTLLLATD
jgi:hypothetical protein